MLVLQYEPQNAEAYVALADIYADPQFKHNDYQKAIKHVVLLSPPT